MSKNADSSKGKSRVEPRVDSFGGLFLDDTDEDFEGLPDIEDDFLSPGYTQNVVLEEASIDEPLPGMDKVYIPREKEWDYDNADFHGDYEKSVRENNAQTKSDRSYGGHVVPVDDDFFEQLSNPSNKSKSASFSDSESQDEYFDEVEDDPIAILAKLSGVDSDPSTAVDTELAFDEVEDQEADDDDDLVNILAGIEGGGDNDDDDGEPRERLETNFRVSLDDEEIMQGFDIDEIISLAINRKASDVHINPGRRIGYRINGSIVKISDFDPIPGEVTRRIQQKIVTNVADDIFLENWELDTSYTLKTGIHRGRRVRASIAKTFEEVMMVMRIISQDIPQPEELEIEDELLEWTTLNRGLVMMNGPTGTGKSTTLASLVQKMQMERDEVILTVEKPVEYMYKDIGRAMIYQREVGRDTLSFSAALDSGMREDPDVILIGEVRNPVEVNALLYAADTGHLSLSTTHANSAAETVNRIKGMFTGEEQRRVLSTLASVSKGYASQVLCKTEDGKGRFAVREILVVDSEVSDLIMQGDNKGIRLYQEKRELTLDHKLIQAVNIGRCTPEQARSKSPDTRYFDYLMENRAKLL